MLSHWQYSLDGTSWNWCAELGAGELVPFHREDRISTQLTKAYVRELKGVGTRLGMVIQQK